MIAVVAATAVIHLTPPDYGRLDHAAAAHTAHRPHRHTYAERKRHQRKRQRAAVVRAAASLLGTPYVWGGTSRAGIDCSGLTQYAYRRIGRYLPRTTWLQKAAGIAVRGPLRRGDLILAYGDTHVAIYAGHGTVIVAPHAGSVVQREPISWLAPFSHVRRLIHRG